MAAQPELHRLSPSLLVWQLYAPAVKTDLFSTAIRLECGWFLVDPFGAELPGEKASVAGVGVTNINHWRNAFAVAEKTGSVIFCHRDSGDLVAQNVRTFERPRTCSELEPIDIAGAPAGEVALFHQDSRLLIVGDALINLEPYGFAFLPPKYCRDHKIMRKSLRQLLDRDFDRIVFAHGLPLLQNAKSRLEKLFLMEAE